MLANVFVKTLRDLRRGLIAWSIGLILLVAVIAAVWPSFRDLPELNEFLDAYPEVMKELFNIEAITSGVGFMNAELYSLMFPALFLIFAIGRGARMVAGEEEDGTLEVLLATPVTRVRVLVDKAAALAVAVTILGIAVWAATAAASPVAGMDIGVGSAATASLAMVLLGLEHGWLALAVGAATGRRGLAIGVASVFAVAGYVLYVLGALVESFEPWRPLSPFHQALEGGPLGAGLPLAYLWMGLVGLAFVAAALFAFDRRDVRIR